MINEKELYKNLTILVKDNRHTKIEKIGITIVRVFNTKTKIIHFSFTYGYDYLIINEDFITQDKKLITLNNEVKSLIRKRKIENLLNNDIY